MGNYIFLTSNYNDENTIYLAIPANKIERLNVSSTYDSHGQLISDEDAGDYISLDSQEAVDVANKAYNDYHKENYPTDDDYIDVEHWKIDSKITSYDYNEEGYKAVTDNKDLTEGVDYSQYRSTCEGFNYHDGHNWQTVTTSCQEGEAGYSILDDEKLIAELNEAIERMEFVKEGSGYKTFKHEGYKIQASQFQSDWETYSITSEEDEGENYEDLDTSSFYMENGKAIIN